MRKIILALILITGLFSCKKEKTSCWHCVDSTGLALPNICDKTESDVHNEHPDYTCERIN